MRRVIKGPICFIFILTLLLALSACGINVNEWYGHNEDTSASEYVDTENNKTETEEETTPGSQTQESNNTGTDNTDLYNQDDDIVLVNNDDPDNSQNITHADNNTNDSMAQTGEIDYPIVSAGDQGVGAYYVDLASEAYDQAPEWVRYAFENDGWRVYVRSGYFGTPYGYNVPLKGLTVPEEKIIMLANKDNCCDIQTMFHEFGHFVDYIYGWPSTSTEFINIFDDEYEYFCNYYNYSNAYASSYELFAEGLYHLWTNPDELAGVAPGTYTFLANNIG